jgi:hypothetical protein
MTVTIYHNPGCGTSRNTLAMIRQSGVEPVILEYLKTPPSRERLVELIASGRGGLAPRLVLVVIVAFTFALARLVLQLVSFRPRVQRRQPHAGRLALLDLGDRHQLRRRLLTGLRDCQQAAKSRHQGSRCQCLPHVDSPHVRAAIGWPR